MTKYHTEINTVQSLYNANNFLNNNLHKHHKAHPWGWYFGCCVSANYVLCLRLSRWLTHLGQRTHICLRKLTIIDSDNGLPPGRRQAIIWANAGILLIGPLGTNICDILTKSRIFSFMKLYLKMYLENDSAVCPSLLHGSEITERETIRENKIRIST